MADNSDYPILVVDDDEPIVKNMRRVLRRRGFTKLVTALNGEQAIKLLETAQVPFSSSCPICGCRDCPAVNF
mgnify:CR=1 FL=1